MVSPAEQLLMNGQEVYRRENKCLILCQYSPISKLKEGTSLYKDVSKEFKDIALGNKFHLNAAHDPLPFPRQLYSLSWSFCFQAGFTNCMA